MRAPRCFGIGGDLEQDLRGAVSSDREKDQTWTAGQASGPSGTAGGRPAERFPELVALDVRGGPVSFRLEKRQEQFQKLATALEISIDAAQQRLDREQKRDLWVDISEADLAQRRGAKVVILDTNELFGLGS